MTQAFQNSKEVKTSKGNFLKYWGVILALSALIIVSFVLYKSVYLPRSALTMLPNPDLTEIEPQVAEELRNRRIAVEKNPDSADSWGKLGMVLDIHNFKRESIPCYKRALALNPTEFRWSYFGAIVLNEMVSPESLEWFERSNQLKPDYVPLQVLYGQALFNAGHLVQAEMMFNRVISLLPESSHGYLGLGKISLAQGNLQETQERLVKAVTLAPNHREVRGVLAEVLRRLGKSEESTNELQIAKELPRDAPLNDPVYEELVAEGRSAVWYRDRGLNLQAQGRLDEAIEELKVAMELRPDPEGYNYIGDMLARTKRYEEAIIYYQKAISVAPDYSFAFNNLGRALLELGQTGEAEAWFQKSSRLNPAFPDPYINLGELYIRLARPADAIATLGRGSKNTRGFSQIVKRLAWLLATVPDASLRNASEAVNLAKAICEHTKYSDPESLDILAAAYAESGDFKKAVTFANTAHEIAESSQLPLLAKQIQSRLGLYLAGKPFHTK